ncbi:MAG: NYN domain-containing protein [Treponema sp.]|nr:NYN domain-containing protein [Treponema sp.]
MILLDGGFIKPKYADAYGHEPSASEVNDLATKIRAYDDPSDSLVRIYYYDSPPLREKLVRPVSRTVLDLATTPSFAPNMTRMAALKRMDYFAVREGRLTCHGWKLRKSGIGKAAADLTDADFAPDIQQKGVDMKIGLDIAWISLGKIADRILVVTGDSDFIPALKLARRNGIQVFLFTLGHGVSPELLEHSDRLITKPADAV